MDYQALTKNDIPSSIWKAAKLSDNRFHTDVIWGYLKSRLAHLGEIAESVLVFRHSSAKLGRLLNSIMRINMSLPESLLTCHEWKPSGELFKKR